MINYELEDWETWPSRGATKDTPRGRAKKSGTGASRRKEGAAHATRAPAATPSASRPPKRRGRSRNTPS